MAISAHPNEANAKAMTKERLVILLMLTSPIILEDSWQLDSSIVTRSTFPPSHRIHVEHLFNGIQVK